MTFLEALVARVRKAGDHNRAAEIAPAVILWPDRDRQWEPLLALLRAAMPELLTHGDYAPDLRSGPAIWLRCVLGGTVADAVSGKRTPVIYLPGVGRSDLRAVESCPRLLQPLAELQYRGSFFGHTNGKDWTVSAFLAAGGLGLDVAEDHATIAALRQVLRRLADVKVDELRGRRLVASDFLDLLSDDFDGDLLRWMHQPGAFREAFDGLEWAGFCSRVVKRFGFHPENDGVLAGAERLVKPSDPAWSAVWKRFEQSPDTYSGVTKLLGQVAPSLMHPHTSPTAAASKEDALRDGLVKAGALPQPKAIAAVLALEAEHAARRAHVWAGLGRTPLVAALEHLAVVARAVSSGVGGGTPAEVARDYVDGGWSVDRAAIRALAKVDGKDAEAVHATLNALYRPWLEAQGVALAAAVEKHGYPAPTPLPPPDAGECIIFADGLRMDVGRWLAEALAKRDIKATSATRWVAFPPVTPTAKPAASPIADKLVGTANEDFRPSVAATGKPLTQDLFKKLLEGAGVQFLDPKDLGDPTGRAWTEFGDIDHYGHEHGWQTARHVEGQVTELVRRIAELFAAGWQRVRVVTDHGWLLLPGGLPKRELHASLANTRWRRCATLKPGVKPTVPTVPWHWNSNVAIAIAPDIGIFVDGADYSHGGLTLQECVVPVLVIDAPEAAVSAAIESIKWVRGTCKVTVKGASKGVFADIRTKANDPKSSLTIADEDDAHVRQVSASGSVSLPVEDGNDGMTASVVLVDKAGIVLAKLPTTVGGEA